MDNNIIISRTPFQALLLSMRGSSWLNLTWVLCWIIGLVWSQKASALWHMSRSSESKKSGNWTNQRRTNFHATHSLACLLPWICLALPLLLPSARTKTQTWRTTASRTYHKGEYAGLEKGFK